MFHHNRSSFRYVGLHQSAHAVNFLLPYAYIIDNGLTAGRIRIVKAFRDASLIWSIVGLIFIAQIASTTNYRHGLLSQ
jgi:hypothetical protein